MPPGVKGFQKGRAKTGGRQRGTRDRADVAGEELGRHAFLAAGMSAEEVDALSPLAAMKLIMAIWLKAGDLIHALEAAQAAAPYCHARLSSSDVKIEDARNAMSDEQLQREIDELETMRFAAMSDEELAAEREAFEARMKAARSGNGYH